jgi:hypothetical protein
VPGVDGLIREGAGSSIGDTGESKTRSNTVEMTLAVRENNRGRELRRNLDRRTNVASFLQVLNEQSTSGIRRERGERTGRGKKGRYSWVNRSSRNEGRRGNRMNRSRKLGGGRLKKNVILNIGNTRFRLIKTQNRRRDRFRVESSPKRDGSATGGGHFALNDEPNRGETNTSPIHVETRWASQNLREINLTRSARRDVQWKRGWHNQGREVEEDNVAQGQKVVNRGRLRATLRKEDGSAITDHKRCARVESRENGEGQRVRDLSRKERSGQFLNGRSSEHRVVANHARRRSSESSRKRKGVERKIRNVAKGSGNRGGRQIFVNEGSGNNRRRHRKQTGGCGKRRTPGWTVPFSRRGIPNERVISGVDR